MTDPSPTSEPMSALLDLFKGRAIGLWRVERDELVLARFDAPELDEAVAAAFADATRRVPLSRIDLGIVKAATQDRPAVSRVAELADDGAGSGHWLRAFGAKTSVAVGLRRRPDAPIVGVLAIACATELDEDMLNKVVNTMNLVATPFVDDTVGTRPA
jgi:hypothetical protein